MTTLTQAELDNAHRRRRTSGYTRFQDAIEDGSLHTAQAWTQYPQCPYNRFGKDGKPPLASAGRRLYEALKKDPNEIGDMPDWWRKIYPGSTHEDWVRKTTETDERILSMAQQVFDACLEAVDWTHWKSAQVEALLDAIPIGSGPHPRHRLLDRVIEAGLPLDRLTFQGAPITPAMRSLLHRPYRAEGHEWVEKNFPIDPPGNGPGFLSVLFMQWARGRVGEHSYWEGVAEKALKCGASVQRPVCPASWGLDDPKERLYGYKAYQPPKTLLALVHTLDSPHLLASITQHHVDDENRISSLLTLMKRTGQVHSRRGIDENPKRQEEHAGQLLRMLEGDAGRPKLWAKASQSLMEAYVCDLWPNIPAQSNPLATQARKRLMELTGATSLDSNTIRRAVGSMTLHLRAFELIENLREAQDDLARMGLDHDTLVGHAAAALVSTAMSSDYKQNKCLVALDELLSHERLRPEFHESITTALFQSPQGGMPLNSLRNLVDLLESKGWKAHSTAWNLIEARLKNNEGRDSAQVLMFLGEVAARHTRPTNLSILNPTQSIASDPQRASTIQAYSEMYPWGRNQALLAHEYIAHLALGTIEDCNARIWSGRRSTTETVAHYMKAAESMGDTDALRVLGDLIPTLLARGADPQRERLDNGEPAEWLGELEASHPFHAAWSVAQEITLQGGTIASKSAPRNRRL